MGYKISLLATDNDCGIYRKDNDEKGRTNPNKSQQQKHQQLKKINGDGNGESNGDGDNDNEEDEDDNDVEYYGSKSYNDRFLEVIYNTEGFREHFAVVNKTGEWIEEFSKQFELVY